MRVFDSLAASGVRYLVWKDPQEVDVFSDGDAELDILLPPDEYPQFVEVVRAHGFARYLNFLDLYGGHVTHFIRFSGCKHYHLHVYDSLLTGDHYAKEYCLDRLFEQFPQGTVRRGVRTLSAEDEVLVGMCRLVFKAASPDSVRTTELERLRSLCTPVVFDAAAGRLRACVSLTDDDVALVRSCLTGNASPAALLRLRPRFARLRRKGRLSAAGFRLMALGSAAVLRRRGLANKSLDGLAPSVAIVGVDGSGKSTLASGLARIIADKTSCRLVYLGGNTRTYGVVSRLLWLATGVAGRCRRMLPDSIRVNGIYYLLQALLEYAKCQDRTRRIARARRLAGRGVVHVFERYPIKGLFDYPYLAYELDAGRPALGPVALKGVRRLLSAVDAELRRIGLPDVVVLVDAPYDLIATRRPLGEEEADDIRRKLELLERFDLHAAGPGLVVLRNDGALEHSLERLCELTNTALCSSSS